MLARMRSFDDMPRYDAVVVGSGPNGLAAAIVLARAGRAVLVREGAATPGGGARTEALTRPGFLHDVFSAVHPLALASPFFRRLPLGAHGLEWIHSPAAVAHPLDDGTAVLLEPSIEETCAGLGADGPAYRVLVEPFATRWEDFFEDVLAPLHLPRHPRLLARFGRDALLPATWIARSRLRGPRARALFAGMAAHSALPLTAPPTAAFGLVLAVAGHAPGFRDRIVARHVMGPLDLQRRNPNLVGGDVGGGASDLRQLFFRPAARLNPYTTPLPGVFVCSSSSPPGGGVHGMCGYYAAHAALRHWPP